MEQWHKTCCVLCGQNCGLEARVEDNRMVKVKGDKSNPRSLGYVCRKGLKVGYHQHAKERLTEPLKKVGDRFEPITWDQAIEEIAGKMRELVDAHGPRSLAYMGTGAQSGHMEVSFGLTLLRSMGSKYYYSSAGQEFSGSWWVFGRMLGKQYNVAGADEHRSEMLVGWGWNGMESHQMPRAPKVLKEFSKNPDKTLVIVDPRKSRTAAIADIHLPVRPGCDSLLAKAMIAIIVAEGWEAKSYIEEHVEGWDRIRPWFEGFKVKSALEVCEVDYEQVYDLCRLLTTKRWSIHPDLGIYMGRHSTLNSYLLCILVAICGRFCVSGGYIIPGVVMPMGFHADERDPKTWRTVATDMPPVAAGSFPPAVMPEEILSDHPERLRAVIVSSCNPLRSYPDTTAYEEAFDKLDLLVVSDIVMSETARLAHYVLPSTTYYEAWEAAFFPWTFPKVFFQARRPFIERPALCMETSQMYTLLADKLGLLPDIPEELMEATKGDRLAFGAKLMEWAATNPKAMRTMPMVLAKTLGEAWGSSNLAAIWGLMMTAPNVFRKNAARVGFEPGMDQGDRIFQAILDNPQGFWIGEVDPDDNFAAVKTPSGKIEVHIPELEEKAKNLDAAGEAEDLKLPSEFPMVLCAGRHIRYNANTLMRDPEWNAGKRACTVAVNPDDASALGLSDGEQVRVTTEAGSEAGELEVSDRVRKGTAVIPHGFGLLYDGEVYGININRLTKNTHRDPLGTPNHRYVPCRVETV
ncbi:MAG: molybdopterin-dependent oxidoreductase [Proteobacteria bacterium]|nr:molybdopterin-dependent oxidoreductase [Pseudomonadota bacterium]